MANLPFAATDNICLPLRLPLSSLPVKFKEYFLLPYPTPAPSSSLILLNFTLRKKSQVELQFIAKLHLLLLFRFVNQTVASTLH